MSQSKQDVQAGAQWSPWTLFDGLGRSPLNPP